MSAVAPGGGGPVLQVVFYRSAAGNQPVREWLLSLPAADRRTIGRDIATAQYGWPVGMPLIRKLAEDLWEIRSSLSQGIARVIFTVEDGVMWLLHGFVKKSPKTPQRELDAARQRLSQMHRE